MLKVFFKELALELQVLEANIGVVKSDGELLVRDAETGGKEAMATTFCMLENKFRDVQSSVLDELQNLKASLQFCSFLSWF